MSELFANFAIRISIGYRMNRKSSDINNAFRWLFGWIRNADAVVLAGILATFLWFVIDWCMATTFRPTGIPLLYIVNVTAALVMMLPWMLTGRKWVAIIVVLLLDILFESNLLYCRTYMTAIPPESYLIAGNMRDFMASAFANVRWSDAGFLVILALTAAGCIRTHISYVRRRKLRYAVLTGCFAGVSAVYIACLGGFYDAYGRLTQEWRTYASGVPTYTIAGHIAYKLMENSRLKAPSEDELAEVSTWLARHRLDYRSATLADPKKSVVLVICESLESWPIGLKIDGKEVTPYLNSLISDSAAFYAPNVLTQVCAGHSIDGQLIYTTGLLPTSNSVFSVKYPDRHFPSLNKTLRRDRNARSILMTIDKPITWNSGTVSRAFGYDSIFNHNDWRQEEVMFRFMSDGSLLRQGVEKLKAGDVWPEGEPGMLTVVTASGHHPFVLRDELKDPTFDISGKDYPKELSDYITMTHYVDSQLHTLVDYIRSRKDSDDIMVVILGDHEAFGSKRKGMRESSPEVASMMNPGRFTPMIVVNSPVGGRFDGVMGQADVYPTVLDMLGVDDDSWRGVGISVLDPSRPNVAFSAMPPEGAGDLNGTSPEVLRHVREAQIVSELIITHDLLEKSFE